MSKMALPTFNEAPVFYTPYPAPLSFQVIVLPKPPDTKRGLIELAKRSRQAEQAVGTIGQIIAIGAKAWGKGPEFDLSGDPQQPAIGDWVVYKQHAGQRLRIRKDFTNDDAADEGSPLEEYILIMTDIDILARFKTRAEAERFYAWV